MSVAESIELQLSYEALSKLAKAARDRGDTEAATDNQTLAINVFAQARLSGYAWASGTSPVN
jgi:hypothetical protein